MARGASWFHVQDAKDNKDIKDKKLVPHTNLCIRAELWQVLTRHSVFGFRNVFLNAHDTETTSRPVIVAL